MKKLFVAIVLVGALALLGLLVQRRLADQTEAGSGSGRGRGNGRAVAVEAHPVETRTIRDVAGFTGTLRPKSRVVVAPNVSGRLEELKVNIGDFVNSEDLVAVLDSAEYDQAVAQAEAELEVSQANLADSRSNLELARREYERVQELREERVVSEADLDQAQGKYAAADAGHEVVKAQIKQREAALEAARVRQRYTRIHATWANEGDADSQRVVAERFVDAGSMLRANDPIVSIVQADPLTAVIHVIERDYPGITVGQEANIRSDAWPGRTFSGQVARKAPVLKEESRQARVELEVPNPDLLLAPGMFVRVSIELEAHEDATAVPASAVSRRNDETGVFLIDRQADTVEFVPVVTGASEDGWVQIIEPEIDGMVVTLGHHLLEDGASVTVVSDDAAPAPARTAGREE